MTALASVDSLESTPNGPLDFKYASAVVNWSLNAQSVQSNAATLDASGGPYDVIAAGASLSVTLNSDISSGFRAKALVLDSDAVVDLDDGTVIIDYTGASPLGDIATSGTLAYLIKTGFDSGTWTGSGIISSAAGANSAFAIGYAEAGDLGITSWGGSPVDSTSVILDYCLKGDTNLDGAVNFTDLVTLATNFNGTGMGWVDGDFNYDGVVNFTDQLALASNYNSVGGSMARFANAMSVPEPSSLCILACVALSSRRQRNPN